MTLNLHKYGKPIRSLDTWLELAPPKEGAAQWLDLRSAKELARPFVGSGAPAVPSELQALLSSNDGLGRVTISEASPEEKISLDEFPDETREADLTALATSPQGTIAMTLEAKADESFGDTVSRRLARVTSPRSNVPQRVERLALALFGVPSQEISGLRYQLLHAAATSLIFAARHGASSAIFAVFEFHSAACSPTNLNRNARELDRFIIRLGGDPVVPFVLQGPFSVYGGDRVPSHIPLFVGKAIRKLWSAATTKLR